jgi:anti-anti-sigma factor
MPPSRSIQSGSLRRKRTSGTGDLGRPGRRSRGCDRSGRQSSKSRLPNRAATEYGETRQRQVELLRCPNPRWRLVLVTLVLGGGLIDRADGWSNMSVKDRGLRVKASALGHGAVCAGRETVSRSPPSPLAVARPQAGRAHLIGEGDTAAAKRQPVATEELAVRWERRQVTLIMWLSGALDRAAAVLLERELDARAVGTMPLVIDLTGLEFIDSAGLDALVRIHWRASKRSDRLTFRHGPHIAQRPVALTRTVRRRSQRATLPAAESDETSSTRAIACVDVDHPRPPVIDPWAA